MNISISTLVALLRPHQYVKNLAILLPLFFVGEVTNVSLLLRVMIAFVAFSASASAVYVFNDYFDIAVDREHPRKRHRPLASGAFPKPAAFPLIALLWVIGLTVMWTVSVEGVYLLALYIAMNILYSLRLKHVAVVDVTIIAIGFVLRLFVGSSVTGIPLSMWIVIMTFLLALFLAFAKRRDDVLLFENTGRKMRRVVDGYNLSYIDGAMQIMASVVIVAYILYTTSPEVANRLQSDHLYFTALFVTLGILRYLQIAIVEENSGSPTRIVLGDGFMQLTIAAWLLSFVLIIYIL